MRPRAPGLLLVLSAPSGAGKTTLARLFVEEHEDAHFSISATTRRPRGAERDGVDYHFMTRSRFGELIDEGAFAEWAEVHGERYGTLRATVEEALASGWIALFDIDVQGGALLKARWPDQTVAAFVLPPFMDELERRLRSRSTDSDEVISRRLAAARSEVARGVTEYDYLIVNDDLVVAERKLDAIVAAERARLSGRSGDADPQVEALRRGRYDVRRWLR